MASKERIRRKLRVLDEVVALIKRIPRSSAAGSFIQRLSVFVIAVAVLVIFINPIVARMVAEFGDMFLLPGFDVVRSTAFGQHPCLEITHGYQADPTAEAGAMGAGK